MKNIKRLTSIAGSVLCALLANPVTAMAATEVEEKSLGETMKYALLNTVMGIGIVFIVLLLISWIIGLFKYIGKIEAKLAAKKNKTAEPSKVETPVEAVEELSDDLELVAVITAAIHAYEEAQGNNIPADGLVVRSIRKVNKAKWQNA